MKKLLIGFGLMAAVLAHGVASTGNAAGFPKGDLNCSGAVTSVDVSLEVLMAAGGSNPFECGQSADLNCSGAVTAVDISIIVSLAAGGSYTC